MSSLAELRDTLVAISHPERWLQLIDDYLVRAEALGDAFILPREHAFLRPALEFYTGDLPGWTKFVRIVRDQLDPKSLEYTNVHKLYKTISTRAIQRRTRALIDVATQVALKKGMMADTSLEAKLRYAKRCVQAWKRRKDDMLKLVRSESPNGRISQSHREQLLKEFWEVVAAEVNNGEVPKP